MRSGTVAIVGRTNVGKSTFLNRVLGQPLAIVSPRPQTTRDTLLGVWHGDGAQIAFLDTPGLHRPRSELGRRMNAHAIEATRSTDAILMMTDTQVLVAGKREARNASAALELVTPEDRRLTELLPRTGTPVLLVVNKVDLLKDKSQLLPLLSAYEALHAFSALIPVSVFEANGIERIQRELIALLPERPFDHEEDTLTDQSSRFFAREYVREQILLHTEKEVPHAAAVSIERFEDSAERALVQATIHVEKPGQRKILVGKGGQGVRRIGSGARLRLEKLLGKKVRLELFVRVTPGWKDTPRRLAELGYEALVETPGSTFEVPKER